MEEKSLDEMIKDFQEYRGDKKFHITGGWTMYPETPDEYHEPMKIVKGPIKPSLCILCNEPLDMIRKDNPKRRLLRYCSAECRVEHAEIEKIRKRLGASLINWPPQKPPIPKHLLTYTTTKSEGKQIPYKARKQRKAIKS